MAGNNIKHFVVRNKELFMFLVGFGIMHYGWYNLQRNTAINKALAASKEKELKKEYQRLEREIANFDENWSSQQHQESQKTGVVLSAITALTEKSSNNH